jgi:excisionase family DNA binding protein
MPDGELLFSIKAVAAYLDVSDKTVRRMIDAGQLPSIKIRGSHRIRWSDLRQIVQKQV